MVEDLAAHGPLVVREPADTLWVYAEEAGRLRVRRARLVASDPTAEAPRPQPTVAERLERGLAEHARRARYHRAMNHYAIDDEVS